MTTENTAEPILDYLRHHLPRYPFQHELDAAFVDELLADFQQVDILGEIKAFRWYFDNQPAAKVKSLRVALRRWIANARARN